MPQTILVVLLEVMKLMVTMMRSGCQKPSFDSSSLRKSTKFLLPSVIYAVNNNIYLAGLILVPPPIWVILCSFRTVVTASLYKFVLKRDISLLQFGGALLIVASIVVAKLGDIMSVDGGNHIPMLAIIFAMVSSLQRSPLLFNSFIVTSSNSLSSLTLGSSLQLSSSLGTC